VVDKLPTDRVEKASSIKMSVIQAQTKGKRKEVGFNKADNVHTT